MLANIVSFLQVLSARVSSLLSGETLRAIVYGGAVVVWFIVGIANSVGITRFGPHIALDDALTLATAAAVLLTELARRFVYSANTVARLLAQLKGDQ